MSGHHVATTGLYLAIFAALLVLTGVTVAVTYVDLGRANLIVAMAIAVTKGSLVVLYFMGLRWSDRLTQVTLGSGFIFFGILVAFTISDYLSRGLLGVSGR